MTDPIFTLSSNNPLNLNPISSDRPFATFADIDNDGDLDAFVGEYDGNTYFYENTGTASNPVFSDPETNPFGLSDVGFHAYPTFVDIDGDGDLDAFVGGSGYGSHGIQFFENTGTASSPVFAAPTIPAIWGSDPAPTFVDIDDDGDFDAFVGEKYGMRFWENTGTASNPIFYASVTNPFGLRDVGYHASPTFVDIDGDGDLDALIGETYGNTLFFRNMGTASNPVFVGVTNPLSLNDVGWAARPTFIDIDGDGDLDALIGENYGNTLFSENTGTASSPAFAAPITNPFGLSDVGYSATPTFVDIDDDGDLDAFVGQFYESVSFFRNTGTASSPAFSAAITNPFGLSNVGYASSPTLVDIDGDGDLDAFVGEIYGNTLFFENTGTASNPIFSAAVTNPFGLSNVGFSVSPTFVDIDDDGDLDAFMANNVDGEFYITFSENTGTASSPVFAAAEWHRVFTTPFGRSNWPETRLTFADIDDDGDFDAFVGGMNGNTLFFENTGTASSPTFDAAVTNPLGLSNVHWGWAARPTLVDIDDDGYLEAFVGTNGGISFFTSASTSNTPPTGSAYINDTTPELGQILTASNDLVDADGLDAITYQWKAGDTLIGTGGTYTVTADEVGKAITVTASYTDGLGKLESVSSAATAAVTSTLETLASASSLELEFFARQVAYGYEPLLKRPRIDDENPGDILPSGHFAAGWELEEEFTTPDGLFRAVALTKPGFEPVLAIRGTGTGPNGTLSDNIADWIANTHILGAGGKEFETAWNTSNGIKQWLMDHPNASITGHSQGGAQAQMLAYEAAKNSIKLGQLVTFNSPGINTDPTSLAGTLDTTDVTHFISAGDIVSQVGVQFVPGKVVYYDSSLQGSLLGVLKLVNDAHTDHWAQQALYNANANFLRKDNEGNPVDVYIPHTVRYSEQVLSIEELNSPDFSHLTLVTDPNIDNDYSNFSTQIENFIASFPPLSLLLGFGPTRAAEILSNRAGSESGRTDELSKLLNLVSNISSTIKQADGLIYTGGDVEKIEFAVTILSMAIELGFRENDEPFEFITSILNSVGSTSVDLALDYARWYGNAIVGIGSAIQDATAISFKKFLSTSKDFLGVLKDHFDLNESIPVVSGNNANSTPAVIVDGQVSDSTMTSASGSSIYIVDDGNETINLTGDNNLIWGVPNAMNGTKVNDFKPSDTLFYFGANLKQSDLSAAKGSAILTLDTDGDGQGDSVVTLAGNFRLESFVVEASSSGSYIRYLGNAVPVAENDDITVLPQGFATDEDSSFTTANVLDNDADGDGDALSITALDTTGLLGLVTDNGDGTFNYDPNDAFDHLNAGETATDSFGYTVSDGNGGSDTATVTVTINGVSHTPVANDDSGSANEDSSVTFSFAQLLANDSHVDSAHDTIVAVDISDTTGSVVIDTANQTITYHADADQFDLLANGATVLDSFKYVLQGNSGETSAATVAINVTGVNDGKSLLGTVRSDTLNGTSGEDVIKGNNSNDIINGGDGADRLFGESGDDRLDGGNSIDSLSGGTGNDRLKGGNGDDSLTGGDGNDRLEGGMGNDWLKGDKGNDMLIGGAGSDIFAFAKAGGRDIVTDFIDGIDKIQIAQNTGVTNFSQLNITSKTESGDALYTTIDWGSSDKILLMGVSSGQLDATDFIFPV